MTTYDLYAPTQACVDDNLNRDVIKRIEDLVLGTLLIVMLSWLLLAIAIAIKLTSEGPVLFIQHRRGRHGTPFRCFKFRTMYHTVTDYSCRMQTCKNDLRITRLGRVLRKTSLDELPQLFNVLLGDMSLVGPRPHALGTNIDGRLLGEIVANYHWRYLVKPGITGWAQVNGSRGILATEQQVRQRVHLDLRYIANWSLWLDITILCRTVTCVFNAEAF